jgi:gliding motility-associated lipoprotein GldH
MNKNFIGIALLLLVAASCNNAAIYGRYKTIGDDGWHKDSVAVFPFDVTNAQSLYDIEIALRNTSAYPYCNVFLFVKTVAPTGSFVCDTVEYMLADKYGRWLGKGFSKVVDNRLAYKRYVQFPTAGIYRIEIRQGMRNVVLPHITDVGVRIVGIESN